MVGQLINGETFPIVREEHGTKYQGSYGLHGVHVASFKEDIIIQLGIKKFYGDEDFTPPPAQLDQNIFIHAFCLG
jgi:hypothetical protein